MLLAKFFVNITVIIVELIGLGFGIYLFIQSPETGAIPVILTSGVLFIGSFITKFFVKETRPRVVFHHKNDTYGREPKGYTANNPNIIRLGIDEPELYWGLDWSYTIEIRNNSSITAYDIKIDYLNKPARTRVIGEIGKIEPIQPNEKRELTFKLYQDVVGTHIEADNYLRVNAAILLKDMRIEASYIDENQNKFKTVYDWLNDSYEFPTFDAKRRRIFIGLFITGCILLIVPVILMLFNYTENANKKTNDKKIQIRAEQEKSKIHHDKTQEPEFVTAKKQSILKESKNVKEISIVPTSIQSSPSIITYNQTGGQNIVVHPTVNLPKPEIEVMELTFENMPIDSANFKQNNLGKKFNVYPTLYKSEIKVKYQSKIAQSKIDFILNRLDGVKLDISTVGDGATEVRGGTIGKFQYKSLITPDDGIYKLTFYTISKIDDYKNIISIK